MNNNRPNSIVNFIQHIMKDFCHYQIRQISDENIRQDIKTVLKDLTNIKDDHCYPIEVLADKSDVSGQPHFSSVND